MLPNWKTVEITAFVSSQPPALQRFFSSPLLWYFLAHGLIAGLNQWNALRGNPTSDLAGFLQQWFLIYLLAAWVQRDAWQHKNCFPYDWSFLLIWLFFPLYLLHSRRWKGWLFLFAFLSGLALLYALISWVSLVFFH